MRLILSDSVAPITLRLGRDLVRSLKRGHPWVFREGLRACPNDVLPGTHAVLLDNKSGRWVARGLFDPTSPVAFRACEVDEDRPLDDSWAEERFLSAWRLRCRLFPGVGPNGPEASAITTGFRLFNGEGDGLPGLVVDIYSDTAVLKLDGDGPGGFWASIGIAEWLRREVRVRRVVERPRRRGEAARMLAGSEPKTPVPFLEHGVRFTTDVMKGQKTGFFLDQRDNRRLVGQISSGAAVLNLFGYTGGFSVYAGIGGATHVTTVDRAQPAVAVAEQHWRLNNLPGDRHEPLACEVFDFLADAKRRRKRWDLVISDPPSFAASKSDVARALGAYHRLAAACSAVTQRRGILALASCSSHVSQSAWMQCNEEGISHARRRGTVLGLYGQPPDHPSPLALPEFRYLKFVVLQLN